MDIIVIIIIEQIVMRVLDLCMHLMHLIKVTRRDISHDSGSGNKVPGMVYVSRTTNRDNPSSHCKCISTNRVRGSTSP